MPFSMHQRPYNIWYPMSKTIEISIESATIIFCLLVKTILEYVYVLWDPIAPCFAKLISIDRRVEHINS